MKIGMKKVVDVDAKVIKICAKCSDCCCAELVDAQGETIHETDGYVPSFMPEKGGDYVTLDIELETGKILNWKPPTKEDLEEFISSDEE